MQRQAVLNSLWHSSFVQLMGPLFDRESRCASRKARNYALRAGYIVVLSVLTLLAWCSVVGIQNRGSATFGISRSSEVGTFVTVRIVCFQFVAAQLIAAVMLGSSLSDELRSGRLSVLMTTPISSVHIIVGKLLSGLLQIALLLAMSLPALAVLRLLGGVPWDFVLAGFGITLVAAMFAGALSLLFSTYHRYGYQAILSGAVFYLIAFVALPAMATVLVSLGKLNEPLTTSILDLTNPFRALYRSSPQMWQTGSSGPGAYFSWPVHCLVMTGITPILLCIPIRRLRRRRLGTLYLRRRRTRSGRLLRGSPILWKENRERAFQGRGGGAGFALIALVVCVLTVVARMAAVRDYEIYVYYTAWGIWMVSLVHVAISAAGAITREKESGAWPVLLTTLLDDAQIVRGKALAALRRNAVPLISACAVQMCFLLCVSSSPRAISVGYCLLSVTASVFFVLAAGLYFGVRLRTTTAASAATIGAYLCLNYIIGGRFNPLFGWVMWKIVHHGGARGAAVYLLAFGMGTTAFVLDTGLGFFLVRRAQQKLRHCVF
ncbi:MAG: ABC transporter permease subunit [Sedimentisphaerales bacterium]|nr:ABC transporter permease subunit [Sedimentisphaerales bacterium]